MDEPPFEANDTGEHDEGGDGAWGLVAPFWIDTDAYTNRDRLMFCCGYEFKQLLTALEAGGPFSRPIHRENASRARMLCGRFKRRCAVTPHEGYAGCEAWSELEVE